MSADPRELAQRHAREDNRNEVGRLARHEGEVRRVTNDRWWRRVHPLLPYDTPVLSDDFDGCVE